ncbi:MAG TPA: tandem-95 repeat protein [Hyphomicrobium sp.]|nr:tandem-95 repeat protein [Hyphomicrobium sp.]
MATINGTAGNDVITGTTANDEIYGGNGNDRINGGAGDDVIYGGDGNDTLTGDAGNDTLYGGNGNDGFFGGGGNDVMYGEAGDDVMYGDAGNDIIYGGDGNDQLFGGTGDDILSGGSGTNILNGGAGNDTFVLEFNSATMTSAMRADLATLKAWFVDQAASAGSAANLAAQTTGPSLTLSALGVTISTIEHVKIFLDGVETSLESFLNVAPVADANVAITTNEDTPFSGQIVASDADGDTLGYAVQQGPSNGVLTLNAATGAYVYTPSANYHGADSFQVTVTDPSGASVVQTVSVGVTSVNDAPTAAAEVTISTNEDTAISGQVVATDIDGDTLGYALAIAPQHGTVTLDASTGQYVYTPTANYNGTDTFRVAIADPSGAAVIQTVKVGIAPVNDAVTVAEAAVAFATQEDKSVSGQVVASDIDGDTLTWSLDAAPSNGTVALDTATGKYTYTPTANYAGNDVFQVAVTDPSGTRALQRVEISISPVADQPTLAVVNPVVLPETTPGSLGLIGDLLGTIFGTKGDDTIDAGIWEDVTAALEITTALVDTDGSETLSIRISDVPAGGVLSAGIKNSDGSWSLTPEDLTGLTLTAKTAQNFTVKVEATATESNGTTATKTANIDIVMKSDGVAINGGGGNDTIYGSVGNDKLSGGNGNDSIYGGEGADKIDGGKGNDKLYGGAGNDYLNGNSGDDTFFWDAGNDVYAGGSGYDTLSYAGATSAINADLSKKIIVGAASGTDSIYGSAMEKIIGTAFADTFKGSSGVDTIDGGAGNDWIRGLGGADILTGGAGNDTFFWEKTDVGANLGVDRIKDFGNGDVLNFSKLVSLGSKPLSDFVKVQDTSQGAIVSAKINGAFVQVATLEGFSGKSASDLLHDGQLLVG